MKADSTIADLSTLTAVPSTTVQNIETGAKVALQVGEFVLPLLGPVGAGASGVIALGKELLPIVGPAALKLMDLIMAHKPAEVSAAEWLDQFRTGPESQSADAYLAAAGADVSGLPPVVPAPTGRGVAVLNTMLTEARSAGRLLHASAFTPTEVETIVALGGSDVLGLPAVQTK